MTRQKQQTPASVTRMAKKLTVSACGLTAFALGLLGIVIPLLPTTPFLLLAAFCFFHGSRRLHQWMESHPWFGEQLRLWRQQRAISVKVRRVALLYLWVTIGISAVFVVQPLVYRLILLGLAVTVSIILFGLKTLPEKELVRGGK